MAAFRQLSGNCTAAVRQLYGKLLMTLGRSGPARGAQGRETLAEQLLFSVYSRTGYRIVYG